MLLLAGHAPTGSSGEAWFCKTRTSRTSRLDTSFALHLWVDLTGTHCHLEFAFLDSFNLICFHFKTSVGEAAGIVPKVVEG